MTNVIDSFMDFDTDHECDRQTYRQTKLS